MSHHLLHQRLLQDSRPQLARLLARHTLWDEAGQTLWVDLTPFDSRLAPVAIPGWERLLTWQGPAPELPEWAVLHWPATPAVTAWKRAIPDWVRDTLQRLPAEGQLHLLYLSARWPQMLEMLDRMPLLAWRIAQRRLPESQLKALFPKPRPLLAQSVGWPGERQTISFLQKLRLRQVTPAMLQAVEHCLTDPGTLARACRLDRINSMALTLAARFPELIDTPLHHALARQPCQPRQCEYLQHLLEDTLLLAYHLNQPASLIGEKPFLIEVEALHRDWLQTALKQPPSMPEAPPIPRPTLPSPWRWYDTPAQRHHLSEETGHPWVLDTAPWLAWHPDMALAVSLTLEAGHFRIHRARTRGFEPLTPAQHTALALLLSVLNGERAASD